MKKCPERKTKIKMNFQNKLIQTTIIFINKDISNKNKKPTNNMSLKTQRYMLFTIMPTKQNIWN